MTTTSSALSQRWWAAALLALGAVVVAVSPGAARAAPYTWSSGVSGATWDTSATNWTGATGTPWDATSGTANTATFNWTGVKAATVNGTVTTNMLTFAPTASSTFTLTGGTIALGGASPSIMNTLPTGTTSSPFSTLTIASTIKNSTNTFIGGYGTTILSGSNSLSGTVTIGSGSSTVNNPEVQLTNSSALDGATTIVLVQSGTNANLGQILTLGNNVLIAGKTLSGSTTTAGRASLQVAAGNSGTWNGNINGNGISFYAYGLLTIGTGTDTSVSLPTLRGSGTGVINSTLTSNFTKTDAGVWIINSTSGTYSTVNNISYGTIQIGSISNSGSASPLGAAASINFGQNQAGSSGWGTLRYTGSAGGSTNRTIAIQTSTIGGGAVIDSAVVGQMLTLAGNVTTSSTNAGYLRLTGSGNGVVSGNITPSSTNSLSFDKAGTGTWTLSGSNNYLGTTTVSAGVLALGSTNALPASGTVQFAGGTLQFSIANTADISARVLNSTAGAIAIDTNGQSVTFAQPLAASNTAGLTKIGSGTLTLSNASSFSGTTSITGGTLVLGNSLALQNSMFDTASIAGLSFGSLTTATFGGLAGTGTVDLTPLPGGLALGGGGMSSSFGGVLSGAGGLTKTGAGTLTLTGSNTYSGTTTVSAGALSISSTAALPGYATPGRYSVAPGATLAVGNAVADADVALIAGAGNFSAGGFLGFDTSAGNRTYSPSLSGSFGVAKLGGGTLTLGGSNSYTGGTLLTGTGTLSASTAAAFGSGTITLQSGWTDTSNALSLGAGMTLANPIVLAQSGGNRNNIQTLGVTTLSGPITITGTGTGIPYDVITTSGTLTLSGGVSGTNFAGALSLRGGGLIQITGSVNMPATLLDLNLGGTTIVSSTGNVWSYTQFSASTNVLRLGASNALASGSMAFASSATGGFDMAGYSQSLAGVSGGTAARIYNNATGTSTLTLASLASNLSTGVAIADGTGGGKVALVMNSAGRMQTLASATSSYSGGTTILAGTLAQGAANALGSPSGALAVNGGTLDLRGFGLSVGLLSGSAGGVITSGTAGAVTLSGSSATDSTFGGVIQDGSGTVAFTKSGVGVLGFTGTNTYSGTTTVSAGVLSISTTAALPGYATAGRYTVAAGATLAVGSGVADADVTSILNTGNFSSGASLGFDTSAGDRSYGSAVSGSIGLSKVGAGTLTLPVANAYTGPTAVYAGTLAIGNAAALGAGGGQVSVAGGVLDLGGMSVSRTGTVSLTGGTVQNGTLTNDTIAFDAQSGTVSAALAGLAGLTKSTAGLVTMSAANTYTGPTTISGGTLALSAAGALTSTGSVSLTAAGATLDISGVSGAGVTLGAVTSATTSAVILGGKTLTVGDATSGTFGGVFSGVGGGVRKSGAGTLTLTGANTYTGATTIAGGTLALSGVTNRLPTATTLAFTGGGLAINGGGANQTVSSLTVSDSTSAAINNVGTTGATLTVTNPITLGGGSGTSTLVVQSATNTTTTLAASGGLTVNSGGALRLALVATNTQSYGGGSVSGTLTINGGSLTLEPMQIGWASGGQAQGGAITTNGVGTLAMTGSGGTIYIDNSLNVDRRLQVTGNVNITTGSIGISQATSQAFELKAATGASYNFSPTSFDRNIGLAIYTSGSSTITGGSALGSLLYRNISAGAANTTNVLTSTVAGPNVGAISICDSNNTAGNYGNIVKLGSNLVLWSGAALPKTDTGYSTVPDANGRIDLGIDVNGFSFDLTGNTSAWQPNSGTVSGTAAQAYWQLSSSSGTGRFIANGYNFVFGTGSAGVANAYTGVGSNVVLESTAGNGVANNLGSGSISTASVFRYSGTAAAATPSTLTSATSIGNLEVSGSGALRILSLSGGAQNLLVSNGILDGGSNSLSFAGSATISGGTVQTGTITAAGGYSLQAGTVSAVLAGNVALAKSSSGTATLSGANTFTGGVTVSGGVLNLGGATALGASGGSLALNGGTVDLRGFGATIGDLSGSSAGTITSSSNTTATLTVGGANSTRFDGTLANSAGTLNFVKQGAGTLTLGGANTFSGTTTISAGTLVLDNVLALQNSTFDTAGSASLSFGTLTAATFGGLVGSGTIDLTALSGGLTVGGGNRSSTYGGVLSGAGGLTKTGTGTFILTGSQTYAGATTISQGTLQVGNSGSAGWIPAGDVTNNGVLAFSRSDTVTFSGNINGSGSVTQSGGGTLTLSGSNGYTGGTLVTGTGMLQVASSAALGTGTITLQSTNTNLPNTVLNVMNGMTISNPIVLAQSGANRNIITFVSGNSELSGPITISGAGNNTNVISNNSGTSRLTISGNITGTAFAGSMSFRGGTIEISGAVNMPLTNFELNSGGTTIVSSTGNAWKETVVQGNSNVLRLGANNALATGAPVQFNGSATGGLDLNGFSQSLPGIYMNGGGTPAARVYNNASGTSTLTFAGLLQDRSSLVAMTDGTGGGKVAVVMNSAGRTQTLASATSSYSGGTTILAGTLAQGAENALGSTSGALAVNGGTLDLRGFGLAVGMLSGSSGGVITSGTSGAVTFTASSASNSTFGGVIQDGSGTVAFTKSGAGTLALTGVNTFSGATTITGGALSISGTGNLPNTSGFSLSSGGGLTYTGGADSFGKSITVAGGTGSVTNAGAGVLTLAGTLSKNGTVLRLAGGQFNVTGKIVGANANSDLLVDGATVTLSNTNSYNGPTFVQNAGTLILGVADAIPSNSAVSLAGSTLTVGGFTDTIGSLSTSGNSTINVSVNGGSSGGLSMGDLSFGGGTNTLAVSMTSPTAGIYNLLTYSGNKTGSFTATGVNPNYTVLTGNASNGVIAVQRKADMGTVSASVANATIITGGSTAIGYTVANTTPTGGATLSFASTNGSNVSGASSGSALANSTSGTISGLFFTGTSIGLSEAGSFTVQDLNGITTTGTGSVSVMVLDHATPAFVGVASTATNLLLDFGTVDQSAGLQSVGYSLTNLASTFGDTLTAGLALTGFAHDSGDTLFDTGLSTFANLLASNTNSYTASFTPGAAGTFSEVFKLSFSDNTSVAGAAQRRDLTVTMNVVVVPEPAAIALAGIGVAAAAWSLRRRRV